MLITTELVVLIKKKITLFFIVIIGENSPRPATALAEEVYSKIKWLAQAAEGAFRI